MGMMNRTRRLRRKWVFSSSDYLAGELFCHAASCRWLLGRSDMGDLLLAGKDVHADSAAKLRNIGYDEFTKRYKKEKVPGYKEARQAAKVMVFSKPGAGGNVAVCLQARRGGPDTECPNGPSIIEVDGRKTRGYKGTRFCILLYGDERCGVKKATQWGYSDRRIPPTCVRCLEASDVLGKNWKESWWENTKYIDYMKGQLENGYLLRENLFAMWPQWYEIFKPNTRLAPGEIAHHISGMIRKVDKITEAANGLFQATLAHITLNAFYRVTRECKDLNYRVPTMAHPNSKPSKYGNGPSPLYGSKAPGFLHDEILAAHPPSQWRDAAGRVGEIMVEEMSFALPDFAEVVEAKPAAQHCWDKRAEPVYDSAGVLQIWEPPAL